MPYHFHLKYGTTINSTPFGFQYPAYCRGPCTAVSRTVALKQYETALVTSFNDQRNDDVFWNGILRVKAGIDQSYRGPLCGYVKQHSLFTAKAIKHAAFNAAIQRLRYKNAILNAYEKQKQNRKPVP